jgi:hypothetical protein
VPADRSSDLRALAQRVVDALPAAVVQEAAVTGSVSRGAADELSDLELLLVCETLPSFEDCLLHAGAAGLAGLDSWGRPGSPSRLVSGIVDGVPVELIWWARAYTEERLDAICAGEVLDERLKAAEAIANAVPLRTGGRLAGWQRRLRTYPSGLAAAIAEDAAAAWGGFAAAGLVTITRPDTGLARAEWLVDGLQRVLRIVFAVNETWPPTHKRLAARVEPLAVKPDRLAARVEAVLAEADPRSAVRGFAELAFDTVALAPSGRYVDRARTWLAEGVVLLR